MEFGSNNVSVRWKMCLIDYKCDSLRIVSSKIYACYVSNVGKIWLEQATCPEKVWLLDEKYNY